MTQLTITRRDHLIAGFAALAISIHVLEAAFPSPLPGVKPGLANVITLVVFLRHGLSMALWVSALRVLGGSLLTGTFLSPAFFMSASGALAVASVLTLVALAPGRLGLGAVGIAVLCALAHMGGQFALAYSLLVPHPGLLTLLPVLMTFALVFGVISGMIAHKVQLRLATL